MQLVFGEEFRRRTEHGGELSRGKRKEIRPFSSEAAIHLTLRSSQARGPLSLRHPRNKAFVHELLYRLARKWHIRVYEFSNNGNHLHHVLHAKKRRFFQNFLRSYSALIARHVMKSKKGKA